MIFAATFSITFASIFTGLRAEVCNTPGCLELASFLNGSMDLTVDPCDDFLDFVCGNYMKGLDISNRPWYAPLGIYFTVEDEVKAKARAVLEANSSYEDPKWLKKVKDYYYSCMDTAKLDKYSVGTMKIQLEKLGGWPVLDSGWNGTDFNWLELWRKLYSVGHPVDQFIRFAVFAHDNESDPNTIEIKSGYHNLRTNELLGAMKGRLQTYLEALVGIAVIFGADRQRAEQDMQEVLKFEISLANLTQAEKKSANTPTKISELQEAWPYISWLDLILSYFGDNLNITEDETVMVNEPAYFENLGDLLRNTPKRVLANYIMTQIVYVNGADLNQEVRNLINAVAYASRTIPTRLDYCYDKVEYFMLTAVAAGYVRKYVTEKDKQYVTKIGEMLKQELIKDITATDWLTDKAKLRSINKVKKIKLLLEYPDQLLNDTIVNELYEDLKVCRWSLVRNNLALRKWNNNYETQILRKDVYEQWDFDMEAVLDPDPSYVDQGNVLEVYAGFLDGFFYSADRPIYVNLGTMGATLAHELTHSIDNDGRHRNENGEFEDLWDNATTQEFLNRADALADEYSTYLVKELNTTLGDDAAEMKIDEIIADHGGFKIARNAVDTAQQIPGQNQKLPGLEQYSQSQIYWIASTIYFCSKSTTQYIAYVRENDPHLTNGLRIQGIIQNSPKFGQDWNCPEGSFMNPKNKFNVW